MEEVKICPECKEKNNLFVDRCWFCEADLSPQPEPSTEKAEGSAGKKRFLFTEPAIPPQWPEEPESSGKPRILSFILLIGIVFAGLFLVKVLGGHLVTPKDSKMAPAEKEQDSPQKVQEQRELQRKLELDLKMLELEKSITETGEESAQALTELKGFIASTYTAFDMLIDYGTGPHSASVVAMKMKRFVPGLGPIRSELEEIKKMLEDPAYQEACDQLLFMTDDALAYAKNRLGEATSFMENEELSALIIRNETAIQDLRTLHQSSPGHPDYKNDLKNIKALLGDARGLKSRIRKSGMRYSETKRNADEALRSLTQKMRSFMQPDSVQ